ncbi:DUF1614 domain-containing protein [Leptolyngbya ohadii]|uniref:DUF1614 domain-containing protein n=1 Tax=Leptolyngbya ohadii TaxID=1962290 RepID=UPI0021F10758|nr:DUF1614 domain-containing protein [Leptolyngbya ohadii]
MPLGEIKRLILGILNIGGAGGFNGIALCGLFALLLSFFCLAKLLKLKISRKRDRVSIEI